MEFIKKTITMWFHESTYPILKAFKNNYLNGDIKNHGFIISPDCPFDSFKDSQLKIQYLTRKIESLICQPDLIPIHNDFISRLPYPLYGVILFRRRSECNIITSLSQNVFDHLRGEPNADKMDVWTSGLIYSINNGLLDLGIIRQIKVKGFPDSMAKTVIAPPDVDAHLGKLTDLYQDAIAFMWRFIIFYHFTEPIIKIINGADSALSKKLVIDSEKMICDTRNKIEIIDENFFTRVVRSDGFGVQGHFRLQPCGEGRADRKLIYIQPFEKGGYTRRSRIEL